MNALARGVVYMREAYDCWRSAWATYLGVSYEELPDTIEQLDRVEDAGDRIPFVHEDGRILAFVVDWWERHVAWLREGGWTVLWIPFVDEDGDEAAAAKPLDGPLGDYVAETLPGEWVGVIRSRTPGREEITHTVVMNGCELLHDPKRDAEGPLLFVGGYVVIPLEPWRRTS